MRIIKGMKLLSSLLTTSFVIFLFALIPLLDKNLYHIDLLVTAGVFVLLALGLNVIVGFAGLLNLGYAAFFAIGAYTYALANLHWHIPFWPSLLLSAFTSAFFGVILAFPALRLSGDYLAIVTLGFGEIVRIILNNLDSITGGPNGLLGINHPSIWNGYSFGVNPVPYYYLLLVLCVLISLALARLENSRIGRAWIAMREDELAAGCMGINLVQTKLFAFGLGAGIAGLAGCLFAGKQGTISPDSFDFILSVTVLAMVVLGGLGSIRGAILGAFVLTLLPEMLRGFQMYRMLLFGIALILMMLFMPQGLMGDIKHREELKKL